jgi:hypothetical protein
MPRKGLGFVTVGVQVGARPVSTTPPCVFTHAHGGGVPKRAVLADVATVATNSVTLARFQLATVDAEFNICKQTTAPMGMVAIKAAAMRVKSAKSVSAEHMVQAASA